MNILFFSSSTTDTTSRLRVLVAALIPEEEIERFNNIESLTQRLRRPNTDIGLAVLVAENTYELNALVGIGDLFSFMRVILIVPDDNSETLERAYQLHPRYLSFLDSDFSEVAAVLAKMRSMDRKKKASSTLRGNSHDPGCTFTI